MRRPLLTLAAAAALGTVLVGCGSDDGGSSASECTPGSTVEVQAVALQFDADSYETETGCVEFQYINDGATPHTLLIKNVDGFKLSMGSEASGSVELEPGTYLLYCDIAGHQSAGMEADLIVT